MAETNDIIAEAKERLELCINADDGDRADSLEDLKFRKGEQWDEQSVRQRELDDRPCLTFNNIPAIIHQVTNDIRQNRQSIHVHPVSDGASREVAEVIEGIVRHIEYDSGADAAYDTAIDYAVTIGFGFLRLVTEYCSPTSFDQDMKIKRIRNPFTVYLDPAIQEADGSDARFAFVTAKMPIEEFKRAYPSKDPTIDYMAKGVGDDENWLGADYVRIAEYYRIEETPDKLIALSNGKAQLASDDTPLPDGVVPVMENGKLKSRDTVRRKVMWYKLTAKEVLESAEIPFDWIPIFPVFGDEIDIDGKVTRSGLVRYAKDPKRMENYWLTAATEEIAMRTKTPWVGAMGAFEGVEEDWAQANVRNFSYLEYNPVTVDGALAPAPQRQQTADVPAGFIAMAGMAGDKVKAVTGIYDASLGNRSNETSGIAIRARQHQGDVGNFHFSDNFSRAIRQLGRCIISGIPKVYDAPRIMRILNVDGTAKTVEVNKPQVEIDEMGQAVHTVLNDLTVGTYDVIVTSGPAYNTLRQEASEAMVQMAGSWPKLMDVAGDKVVRAFDWPGADEIAERIEKTMPPGLVDKPEDQKQPPMVQTPNGPIPLDQAGQLIGQMDQTLSAMQQDMEKHEAGIQKAEIAAQASIEVARINANARNDAAELAGAVQLMLAKIDPILAHQAAVMAAADPAHPDAPAPIAQGLVQPPADAASQQGQGGEPAEPAPQQPDMSALLEQLGKHLSAPRHKKMSITAPSGAVYQGEVHDTPAEQQGAE